MPESFYGGKMGQSFTIAARFKNKVELDTDLAKKFNSEIPMNSFVAISYGRKNTEEYEVNKAIDQQAYGEQFDSTLWYKVYSEVKITAPTNSLDRYGIKYVLIYDLAGQTPTIDFTETEKLNPVDDPYIDIFNIDDSNYPILQAHLPRAVNWYVGLDLSERLNNQRLTKPSIIYYIGDIYLNQYNGNLFKCIRKTDSSNTSYWNYEGNILGPTLDVNEVNTETLGPLENANVEITQERDENGVLIPLVDFYFSIPRGSRFYSGQGLYSGDTLSAIPDQVLVKDGDYFLESLEDGKIGFIYKRVNNNWVFDTSIFGKTPIIDAESKAVNPDKRLIVEVVYQPNDTAHNYPLLKFDIPRGSKIFTQDTAPIIDSTNPSLAGTGDYWFNIKDGGIYLCENGNWDNKVGNFIIDLTNIQTVGIDPYIVNEDGSVEPNPPEFVITADEDHSVIDPLVYAKVPNAPIATVNENVEILNYEDDGKVSLTYNEKGYMFNFKLPRGPQGEIGQGINIRRSYETIEERDSNPDGVLWQDSEACAVSIPDEPGYYEIYIYQSDFLPDKWVYIGKLFVTSIDDNSISTEKSWSSQKINDEISSLETDLEQQIKDIQDGLGDIINQDIADELASINQKLEEKASKDELNNLATKQELATTQNTIIAALGAEIQNNNEMITALYRGIATPTTWGELKVGKRIQVTKDLWDLFDGLDRDFLLIDDSEEL